MVDIPRVAFPAADFTRCSWSCYYETRQYNSYGFGKLIAYRQRGGGGETKNGAMIRKPTVKNLPRTTVAEGSETRKGELEESAGAMAKETNFNTLPEAVLVDGGQTKRPKPTRNGKVAQSTVPRGEEVPSRKRTTKIN